MTSTIQPSSQPCSDVFHRVQNGIIIDGKIMLLQTPVLTGLNRISVVCCYRDLPITKSIKAIYMGEEVT